MDKLAMAHQMALAIAADGNVPNENIVAIVWQYADAMQAEADKREKEEAEQKRKEMRELLNAKNTFIEREGQHFDDVEWQPDWSQAPEWANWWVQTVSSETMWCEKEPVMFSDYVRCFGSSPAPSFNYKGDWRNSLRKRPE